jgi:ubiquitin carboxyl-terminal hydrolase 1
LLWSAAMVLESLGLGLPWSWTNGASSSFMSNGHERKKSKKKHVRSRVEQQALANGHARPGTVPPQHILDIVLITRTDSNSKSNGVDDGYYPGLVNISGTYCFMNSTLQVCVCTRFQHGKNIS